MKKKWWIILIIAIVLASIIGWYCYARYNCIHYFDDLECLPSKSTCSLKSLIENKYWCNGGERVPTYLQGGICGSYDAWECPNWFLEEKELSGNCPNARFTNDKSDDSLICGELPEWWEEAGCVEKTMNIYCKDILN